MLGSVWKPLANASDPTNPRVSRRVGAEVAVLKQSLAFPEVVDTVGD